MCYQLAALKLRSDYNRKGAVKVNLKQLERDWKIEEAQAFKGWDFSYIKGRWESTKLSWDYKKTVLSHLKQTDQLLDMGTGGGEFLLTLKHPYHLTAVTEAYEPNVKLCEEKLTPLGIQVRQVFRDEDLPFESSSFDIIINRHESFDASEIRRILKKGGYFITQQVGGKNDYDLSQQLIEGFKPMFPQHDLKNNVKLLKQQGFEIIKAEESFIPIRFYDIGALVYFAKVIEWEFPGFSVDGCLEQLYKLQKQLERNKYIQGTEHRFMIIAKALE